MEHTHTHKLFLFRPFVSSPLVSLLVSPPLSSPPSVSGEFAGSVTPQKLTPSNASAQQQPELPVTPPQPPTPPPAVVEPKINKVQEPQREMAPKEDLLLAAHAERVLIVGRGVVLTANVTSCDKVVVEGQFQGNIKADTFVLSEGESCYCSYGRGVSHMTCSCMLWWLVTTTNMREAVEPIYLDTPLCDVGCFWHPQGLTQASILLSARREQLSVHWFYQYSVGILCLAHPPTVLCMQECRSDDPEIPGLE